MLCKNRITLIGFLGRHAKSRSAANGSIYTRFSIATSVSWKVKETGEYNTRTEWHRVISWNKLGQWAASLQKGAYVQVEGELTLPGVHSRGIGSQRSRCRDLCQLDPVTGPLR